jgi:SUMO ligase MMS21 Smc5/6 complex component
LLRSQWQRDEAAGARCCRHKRATCDLLPQVKSKYGHSFDRSCVLKWLQQQPICPVSSQPLTPADLVPDPDLERRIHAWQIQQTLKQQRLFDDLYEF